VAAAATTLDRGIQIRRIGNHLMTIGAIKPLILRVPGS
jgi:hypothetical protein